MTLKANNNIITGGSTLATLDTTTLPNGMYYVVLGATDNTGKFQSNGALDHRKRRL